ncbi:MULTISPECIES: hypothetical protein [unclassified Corynebacterium]|uniref:hypothetical protein n=1 Tax=unclassified Corynebacterium TaxID=2624378 RepID=UPI0021672784|nr:MULTISPECIES: hypothetical protein [unclassified Corynebacterium]MCS4491249.1 hypothetical protein [Corynebacterium sp. ES2715-CONJ3]MCS4531654.1 hypothetical protein [Corynebacterium sp. ES2730-CONJ]
MKRYTTYLDPLIVAADIPASGEPICTPAGLIDSSWSDSAALIAYPSGKHHMLVKAAEARLAVSLGARLVIVVADPGLVHKNPNAFLTEAIMIREAASHPTTIAYMVEAELLNPADLKAMAHHAKQAGIDALVSGTTQSHALTDELFSEYLPTISMGPQSPEQAMIWLDTSSAAPS